MSSKARHFQNVALDLSAWFQISVLTAYSDSPLVCLRTSNLRCLNLNLPFCSLHLLPPQCSPSQQSTPPSSWMLKPWRSLTLPFPTFLHHLGNPILPVPPTYPTYNVLSPPRHRHPSPDRHLLSPRLLQEPSNQSSGFHYCSPLCGLGQGAPLKTYQDMSFPAQCLLMASFLL